ncbi:MAG: hypothetical protein J6L96_00530 [Clostridia bacterium]|nr:hypothetical protein [Clostridia bacterium]
MQEANETKKMTKEEILEIFKSEYKSVLRQYERRVEKYTLKMNEDYEYFFRWHSGDMYVATVNLQAVRSLRPATSWDDLGKIETWLTHQIQNIELTLIEGSQTPSSTNMMMNAAEVLKRVAMQELRQNLQSLLMIVTYNK